MIDLGRLKKKKGEEIFPIITVESEEGKEESRPPSPDPETTGAENLWTRGTECYLMCDKQGKHEATL